MKNKTNIVLFFFVLMLNNSLYSNSLRLSSNNKQIKYNSMYSINDNDDNDDNDDSNQDIKKSSQKLNKKSDKSNIIDNKCRDSSNKLLELKLYLSKYKVLEEINDINDSDKISNKENNMNDNINSTTKSLLVNNNQIKEIKEELLLNDNFNEVIKTITKDTNYNNSDSDKNNSILKLKEFYISSNHSSMSLINFKKFINDEIEVCDYCITLNLCSTGQCTRQKEFIKTAIKKTILNFDIEPMSNRSKTIQLLNKADKISTIKESSAFHISKLVNQILDNTVSKIINLNRELIAFKEETKKRIEECRVNKESNNNVNSDSNSNSNSNRNGYYSYSDIDNALNTKYDNISYYDNVEYDGIYSSNTDVILETDLNDLPFYDRLFNDKAIQDAINYLVLDSSKSNFLSMSRIDKEADDSKKRKIEKLVDIFINKIDQDDDYVGKNKDHNVSNESVLKAFDSFLITNSNTNDMFSDINSQLERISKEYNKLFYIIKNKTKSITDSNNQNISRNIFNNSNSTKTTITNNNSLFNATNFNNEYNKIEISMNDEFSISLLKVKTQLIKNLQNSLSELLIQEKEIQEIKEIIELENSNINDNSNKENVSKDLVFEYKINNINGDIFNYKNKNTYVIIQLLNKIKNLREKLDFMLNSLIKT